MMQVKLLTVLSGEFVRDMGGIGEAQRAVPLPPAPHWFARGPRGGVYLATGSRMRSWSNDAEDFFIRNQWAVIDASEDSRYIRPRTSLHREALRVEPQEPR